MKVKRPCICGVAGHAPSTCRVYRKAYDKAYREANLETVREKRRGWDAAHRPCKLPPGKTSWNQGGTSWNKGMRWPCPKCGSLERTNKRACLPCTQEYQLRYRAERQGLRARYACRERERKEAKALTDAMRSRFDLVPRKGMHRKRAAPIWITCRDCHETLPANHCNNHDSGHHARCRSCAMIRAKQNATKWRKANPEAFRGMVRGSKRRSSARLTDGYVRKTLVKMTHYTVRKFTPSVIAAKREQLRFQRTLKEAQRAIRK